LHLGLNGIDESNVDEIVNNPVGVLVGSSFHQKLLRSHAQGFKGIRLANNLDTDNISASMKNGILTISIPKIEKVKSKKSK